MMDQDERVFWDRVFFATHDLHGVAGAAEAADEALRRRRGAGRNEGTLLSKAGVSLSISSNLRGTELERELVRVFGSCIENVGDRPSR